MSEWISVTERLPELNQVVALLDTDRWMNTGSDDFDCNWHGAGYLCEFVRKYWTVFGVSASQTLDSATHWMPLPLPPQCPPITAYSSSPLSGSCGSLLSGGGGIGRRRMNERDQNHLRGLDEHRPY